MMMMITMMEMTKGVSNHLNIIAIEQTTSLNNSTVNLKYILFHFACLYAYLKGFLKLDLQKLVLLEIVGHAALQQHCKNVFSLPSKRRCIAACPKK